MNIKEAKYLKHIAPIFVILMLSIGYFFPQLQGKVIRQTDIVSSAQATIALKNYGEENGKEYLWNPAQFGGMPKLAHAPTKNNLTKHLYPFFRLGFAEPIGLYIAGSLVCYFMFIFFGCSPMTSLIFSIAAMYSTDNILLYEAGHNSKIRTVILTPFLILGSLAIFEKRKYLVGFASMATGLSLSFYMRHPQMTYYILLVLGIYGVLILIDTFKSKEWMPFMKGVATVGAAIVLSLLVSASKNWSLYDYSKTTMRGDAILESTGDAASGTKGDGLDWEYAMQWSHDFKDIMAGIIPGFVGGSNSQKVSTNSRSFKDYRLERAPMYWGNLPFTVGPFYYGASIVFIFVLSLFWVKGRLKLWLGISTIVMILLSMGKNVEIINSLLFDYFPFYNKFRAPSSVMNITSHFIALLGAMGISVLIKLRLNSKKKKTATKVKRFRKQLLITFGICGGMTLLTALIGPSMFDFSAPGDSRYAQQGIDVAAFVQDRKSMMTSAAWRSFVIIALISGLIFFYLKSRVSKLVLLAGITIIVLFDLITVNTKYLNHNDFVTERVRTSLIDERPVDKIIKQNEKDRSQYRVHDLTIDYRNSSRASVAHNTIGGYHPAKMQRAEDLIDYHISKNNMNVLNMLNTKYFIVNDGDGKPTVQRNPGALGVSWFVEDIQIVNTPNEEIAMLDNIDPGLTAIILESEFGRYINGFVPSKDSLSTIFLTQYEPDELVYNSNSTGQGLAVFSEMWYGPDKGWLAYIDNEPVEHIRVNYALRALKVPPGQHEIRFVFRPKPFYVGETISLIGSLILLSSLLGIVTFYFRSESTLDLNI